MSSVLQEAREMAKAGLGWENLSVKLGLTEAEARFVVFGQDAYMRWKVRQEKKAS